MRSMFDRRSICCQCGQKWATNETNPKDWVCSDCREYGMPKECPICGKPKDIEPILYPHVLKRLIKGLK